MEIETAQGDEAWAGTQETLEDAEERRVLYSALDSFAQYRKRAHYNTTHRRRQNFYALPSSHQDLLKKPPFSLLDKFNLVDDAIAANAIIASQIFSSGLAAFGVPVDEHGTPACQGYATPEDLDKARSTLRQFWREWSEEGTVERDASYGVVLQDLERLFGEKKEDAKVLVPGAGLGRLVFEACRLGFDVEGNEISFHQLVASNWVLNQVGRNEVFELFPSTLNFSNQVSRDDQLVKVSIPDIHPGAALELSSEGKKTHAFQRMAMSAADFVVLYNDEEHKGAYGAVVTVFFIDTAPNAVRYIEAIRNTLKTGGVWINIGPLLWHHENRGPSQDYDGDRGSKSDKAGIAEPGAFELTSEELLLLAEHMGFVVEQSEIREDNKGYIQDPKSMVQSSYRTLHFIARKR